MERHLVLGLFGLWLACQPISIGVVVQSGTEGALRRKETRWGSGLTPNPT